jgi:hypothetical protein
MTRVPRLIFGRLGPSNTKSGVTGSLSRHVSFKNIVRSSGFSPACACAAVNACCTCESHILQMSLNSESARHQSHYAASMPMIIDCRPRRLLSNPSLTATSFRDRCCAAGRSNCHTITISTARHNARIGSYIPKAFHTHCEGGENTVYYLGVLI